MCGPPGVRQNQSLLNLKHFISEQSISEQKSQECEQFCMNKGTAEYCVVQRHYSVHFLFLLLEIIFSSPLSVFLYLSGVVSKLSTSSFFSPNFYFNFPQGPTSQMFVLVNNWNFAGFFQALLRYDWHETLHKFKVYSILHVGKWLPAQG